ncbi:evC complex member EVC-like isoform X2 [Hypanus sabinus]|uniref:evC complex member EVC-like isoform X2 n=1 Tax=Hypanus sabinus TaxID=79690 RepID=UPI0028C47B95|nr:evC complex member EVC-like isoform X2 [Hypanus sabinus]
MTRIHTGPESCAVRAVIAATSSELQIYSQLLTTAVALGVFLGIIGGFLLYFFVLESVLQRRQTCSDGIDDSSDSDDTQSYDSNSEIAVETTKAGASAFQEEDELSINSNVAVFALKAKIIYPINQKFRPLADGSSNPSLLENFKQQDYSKRAKQDFVLSGPEAPGEMEEGNSNYFVENYSPPDTKTYNEDTTILMLTFFPEILCYSSPEADLGLYRLSLQDLRQLDTDMHQEKCTIFLQLLRMELNNLYLREKIDESVYRDFLSMKEKELKELLKKHQSVLPDTADREESNCLYTLEEIERDEQDYLQYAIQQMSKFFQQTEILLKHSELPEITVREIMQNIGDRMSQVESMLTDTLTSQVMVIVDKLMRWKFMAKSLYFLKRLAQQENRDKLKMVTSVLDTLTRDTMLTSLQKEELTPRLQNTIWGCVNTLNNEFTKQTKDIILGMKKRRRTLLNRLEKTQREHAANLMDKARRIFAPDDFIKSYHELEERNRQIRSEMEDEEDHNDAKAVTELWKTVDKLIEEFFSETLPNLTEVSSSAMEALRSQMQQELRASSQAAEEERKWHLTLFQEKLVQMKQEWLNEKALNSAKQKHLVDYQEQIIQNFLLKQTALDEKISNHIVLEHKTALQSVVRWLTLRHLGLMTLKEMKLYKTKCQMDELGEQRLKELPIWDEHEDESKKLRDNLVSRLSKEKEMLCQETESLLHQQFTVESRVLMDLLQHHMLQVIGCALVQQARTNSAQQNHIDSTHQLKNLLVERTMESVYVTLEGANGLIQKYFQQIEETMEQYRKDKGDQLRSLQDTFKRKQHIKEKMIEENLSAGMANVKTKRFNSTKIQHQMMLQQRRIISMLLLEEEINMEFLKQRGQQLHQLKQQLDKHLKMAEEIFISELAGLTRISQAEWKILENKFLSGTKNRTLQAGT